MNGLGGGLKSADWSTQHLEKFEKNFYREDPKVSARSDREIEEFRRSKEMKVSTWPIYKSKLLTFCRSSVVTFLDL